MREPHPGRPTVVSFEIDYSYGFPVVDASPGVGGVDVLNAERLGIPRALGQRLAAWADLWEDVAMRYVRNESLGEHTRRDEEKLAKDGGTLLHDLRRELDDSVELLVDGVPFDDWREGRRRPGG